MGPSLEGFRPGKKRDGYGALTDAPTSGSPLVVQIPPALLETANGVQVSINYPGYTCSDCQRCSVYLFLQVTACGRSSLRSALSVSRCRDSEQVIARNAASSAGVPYPDGLGK